MGVAIAMLLEVVVLSERGIDSDLDGKIAVELYAEVYVRTLEAGAVPVPCAGVLVLLTEMMGTEMAGRVVCTWG